MGRPYHVARFEDIDPADRTLYAFDADAGHWVADVDIEQHVRGLKSALKAEREARQGEHRARVAAEKRLRQIEIALSKGKRDANPTQRSAGAVI
jgi:hypothetical protein